MPSSHRRKRLEIGQPPLPILAITLWLPQNRTLYLTLRIDSSVGENKLPANALVRAISPDKGGSGGCTALAKYVVMESLLLLSEEEDDIS